MRLLVYWGFPLVFVAAVGWGFLVYTAKPSGAYVDLPGVRQVWKVQNNGPYTLSVQGTTLRSGESSLIRVRNGSTVVYAVFGPVSIPVEALATK